ncbi:MAG: hypothetical protein KIS66_10670 [Fimbriimonadaceae bacterium]|nr:hypothetical protein [Fimbriimonadaceae bacterium]
MRIGSEQVLSIAGPAWLANYAYRFSSTEFTHGQAIPIEVTAEATYQPHYGPVGSADRCYMLLRGDSVSRSRFVYLSLAEATLLGGTPNSVRRTWVRLPVAAGD